MNNLSGKIIELKNRMNLKNVELAKLSGIPNSTLADILRGKTERISFASIKLLADTLGCSLDYLANDDAPSPEESQASEEVFLLREEAELLSVYRELDQRGKEAVTQLARQQYFHCSGNGNAPVIPISDDGWKRYVGTVTAARGGMRLIDEKDAKEIAKIKQAFLEE
jgi:transcriptional regulator with XRE-family HTH domain